MNALPAYVTLSGTGADFAELARTLISATKD
jgi:hypothetical protein